MLATLTVVTLIDALLLFGTGGRLKGERQMEKLMEIGSPNEISIVLASSYPFAANVILIDELPVQCQIRDFEKHIKVLSGRPETINYTLNPTSRGEYHFGKVLCYLKSPLRILERCYEFEGETVAKVYPIFRKETRYRLNAVNREYAPDGQTSRVRRLGHSLEFEKIKEYVKGDDVRTINWKATARSSNLMVNTYTDTRRQEIYCLIDKGRNMKMPFDGLTLLDHSINAALSLMNAAIQKQDKAGLFTFSNVPDKLLPADNRPGHMQKMIETLYAQKTDFKETDYEAVLLAVRKQLKQRTFMLLFTNYESLSGLKRQLPHLVMLSKMHLLCVVFFENTLINQIKEQQPENTEGIYIKTIADQFVLEKKLIVKELRRHGIVSILTTPARLSTDVISKYLELKAVQKI